MKMQPKYAIIVTYEDFDPGFDRVLESTIGRESCGSGFGMGVRDISFYYVRQDAATRALKKLKRFKRYNCKVTLELISEDEDE